MLTSAAHRPPASKPISAPSIPTASPTPGITRNQRSATNSSDLTWSPRGSSCWVTPRLNPSCACQSTDTRHSGGPDAAGWSGRCGARPVTAGDHPGFAQIPAWRIQTKSLHRDTRSLRPVVIERPPHRSPDEPLLLRVEDRRKLRVVGVEDPELLVLVSRIVGPVSILEHHDRLARVGLVRIHQRLLHG